MRGLGAQSRTAAAPRARRSAAPTDRARARCRRVGLEALRDLVAQREAGAESPVAGMQIVERRAQRRTVERRRAGAPPSARCRRCPWVHLLHQPHALLRVADRHAPTPAARPGSARHARPLRRGPPCAAPRRVRPRWVLEQHGQRQLHARACARSRAATCVAVSELPPSAKKWSCTPKRSCPSSSRQISHTLCSTGSRGGTGAVRPCRRCPPAGLPAAWLACRRPRRRGRSSGAPCRSRCGRCGRAPPAPRRSR